MSIFTNETDVREYYEDVRNDSTETTWALVKYDGKVLADPTKGSDYDEMLGELGDDDRGYAYIRFETGDEMSRRAKFAFVTWVGPAVGALKKAKVSTDKAFIKAVWSQFGKEILADEKAELRHDKIQQILEKASGASYGTGK